MMILESESDDIACTCHVLAREKACVITTILDNNDREREG